MIPKRFLWWIFHNPKFLCVILMHVIDNIAAPKNWWTFQSSFELFRRGGFHLNIKWYQLNLTSRLGIRSIIAVENKSCTKNVQVELPHWKKTQKIKLRKNKWETCKHIQRSTLCELGQSFTAAVIPVMGSTRMDVSFYLKRRSGNFDWSLLFHVLIPLKIATFLDQVICITILKLYVHSTCENRHSFHYSL